MQKSISILLSILTVIAMVVTVNSGSLFNFLSVKAYAENANEGKCGEDVMYSFNENSATLTISGYGKMYDYSMPDDNPNGETAPWYQWSHDIKTVKITEGVSSVGAHAFENCYSITKVVLGEKVSLVDSWAFQGCSELKDVNIPSSLSTIGRAAFCDTGLKKIILPDTVKELGRNAFSDCENMTHFEFPRSIKIISRGVLSNCSKLTTVILPPNATNISRELFYGCKSLASVKIPSTVEHIGLSAFVDCIKLNTISLPKSVTEIQEDAFLNTGVYNNRKNWENGALYISKCLIAVSTSVKGDFKIKDGTRMIGAKAFYDCKNITSITIPSSVQSIYILPFTNCSSLKSVTFLNNSFSYIEDSFIPDGSNITINCYQGSSAYVFSSNHNLKYVLIPENVNKNNAVNSSVDGQTSEDADKITDESADENGVETDDSSEKFAEDTATSTFETSPRKSNTKIIMIIIFSVAAAITITALVIKKIKDYKEKHEPVEF